MFKSHQPTKFLYLMRHAKAEEGFGKADFDRDLYQKGYKRMHKAVECCKERKAKADVVLHSAANRTKQTAVFMADALGWDADKMFSFRSMYLCSAEHILHQLYALDDEVQHAWVVAHNPGISDVAYALNSECSMWLPTAGIVSLSFNISHWHQLTAAKSKIIFTFLG